MYDLIVYETELGNSPLKKYMEDLIRKNKQMDLADIKACIDRLQKHGMEVNNFYPRTIRQLEGDIYELRPDNHRVVFFYYEGNKIVLLHAFKKQHAKAPRIEIEKAKREMKDYKGRNNNGKRTHF